jgi:hypothetical protein
MTSIAEKTERHTERIVISLPIRVEAHEVENPPWLEVTHLESVSNIGAGFYLTRSFEVGQLLFLTIPLERDLRRYDHDKDQYSVWGIVRHCHRTLKNNLPVYHVGVAFIGQEPPSGYFENPSTIYQLGEINESGFWEVSDDAPMPSRRVQTRYTIPIDIYIAVFDAEENILAHERTVTENISVGGASVFSALQLNVGDTVKFIKQYGNFTAEAVVRNRRIGEDNLPRLHLEFVNVQFPLEGID